MKIKRWKGRVCWSKSPDFAGAIGVRGYIDAEGPTRIHVKWPGDKWSGEMLDKARANHFIRLRGED